MRAWNPREPAERHAERDHPDADCRARDTPCGPAHDGQRARQRHGIDLLVGAHDRPPGDARLPGHERREHRAVRDHVDEPRHPAGEAVRQSERRHGEEPRGAPLARDRQPVADVRDRLAVAERTHVPAERDALVQLRHRGVEEECPELRLADQHDAQELLRRGLEVREQAQLLEQIHRERLRLVDHDDRDPSGLALCQQMGVQRVDQLHLAAARPR